MLEPMHSLVTNCSVVDACVQVRAESPMEHSAQGKRSDTLGLPMLEQSRPERAKALQCALGFYRTAIKRKSQAVGDGMTGACGCLTPTYSSVNLPLLVCYAAYFVQINKFRICNDYIKYIYLPHEQISRHIEWHLAILLQWLQADDMGAHLVADYCAQIVCDICDTALLLFPSGYARTQQ